ncbi:hypothetical protein V6N11_045982 [Hibiscus sabdariffa]|uniref:Uncharacterized protein n=2 Tax=Hibiscus sabdariffa TaxID=183260 RepID=A0ABR2Q2J6_9ROSI
MALMAWNVRGLGNKQTVGALKNASFKFHPSIIFLSETKRKRGYLEKIKRKLKYDNSFYVDLIGRAGGLALWWTSNPRRSEGDAILEKLDRSLSSVEWSLSFPKAITIMDVAITSDHSPIVLFLNGMQKKGKKDFKFESKWLLEEDCSQNILEEWDPGPRGSSFKMLGKKLIKTKMRLIKWSREKYGRNKQTVEDILGQVDSPKDVWLHAENAYSEFATAYREKRKESSTMIAEESKWNPPEHDRIVMPLFKRRMAVCCRCYSAKC